MVSFTIHQSRTVFVVHSTTFLTVTDLVRSHLLSINPGLYSLFIGTTFLTITYSCMVSFTIHQSRTVFVVHSTTFLTVTDLVWSHLQSMNPGLYSLFIQTTFLTFTYSCKVSVTIHQSRTVFIVHTNNVFDHHLFVHGLIYNPSIQDCIHCSFEQRFCPSLIRAWPHLQSINPGLYSLFIRTTFLTITYSCMASFTIHQSRTVFIVHSNNVFAHHLFVHGLIYNPSIQDCIHCSYEQRF